MGPHIHRGNIFGTCARVRQDFERAEMEARINRQPMELFEEFKPARMLVWPIQMKGADKIDVPQDVGRTTFELCTLGDRWRWVPVEGVVSIPATGAQHFVLVARDGVTIVDPTVEQFLPTQRLFGRIDDRAQDARL